MQKFIAAEFTVVARVSVT